MAEKKTIEDLGSIKALEFPDNRLLQWKRNVEGCGKRWRISRLIRFGPLPLHNLHSDLIADKTKEAFGLMIGIK